MLQAFAQQKLRKLLETKLFNSTKYLILLCLILGALQIISNKKVPQNVRVYICTLCNYKWMHSIIIHIPQKFIESSYYSIHLQAWLSFNAAHNQSPRSSECTVGWLLRGVKSSPHQYFFPRPLHSNSSLNSFFLNTLWIPIFIFISLKVIFV